LWAGVVPSDTPYRVCCSVALQRISRQRHALQQKATVACQIKGELTLQAKAQKPQSQFAAEAEVWFRKAIDTACRQRAKALELRAVISLSQLWQQQGKKDEARQMLAEIYGWFTEGFDTKDLQEANARLTELA